MAKELYLYSPIFDSVAESLIAQIEDNLDQEVAIRANSPGGSVFAGYGLAAKISEHGNVKIKVDGNASSMMANILMYAKSSECLDVSTFTLHRADMRVEDEQDQAFLDKVNKGLKAKMTAKIDADLFKQITGYTIDEMFDPEKRINIDLDASQAKKIGLVQKVIKLSPAEAEALNNRMAMAFNNNSNQTQKMDLAKLKAEHPALVAEIEKAATAAERDRATAWMAFAEIDTKAVVSAVKDGSNVTQTVIAEMGVKQFSQKSLNAIKADSAGDVTTGEVLPEADAKIKAEEAEKAKLTAFKESVINRAKENIL